MYLDIYRIGYFVCVCGVGEKLGPGKVFCLTYTQYASKSYLREEIDFVFLLFNGYMSRVTTKNLIPSLLKIHPYETRNSYQWKVCNDEF